MQSALSQIEFRTSDGQPANLSQYAGKVLLIVNVASKCGLTPQYDGLESMYEKYKDRGLVVLGFPANEFGNQEPGTNAEIQDFCRMTFGVQFPVFEKIVVKGEGQHPLYKHLTSTVPNAVKNPEGTLEKSLAQHGMLSGKPGDILWNFEKFLIDREGQIVGRFAPDVGPDEPMLIHAIETQLGK